MNPAPICYCEGLRSHSASPFDWSELEELSVAEAYPGSDVDCHNYVLRCRVCGQIWELEIDQTPVMPAYSWREITTR